MSYCVNCGVELAKSERRCPLCGVEVINPLDPWDEKTAMRPYPRHVEHLNARVDRRYTATFISLMLLIPAFVSIFTNLMTAGALTWSLYVAGGLLVAFTVTLLPLLLNYRPGWLCVLLDGAASALFLLFIELSSGGNWFLRLGLPLTCIGTLLALLLAWLSTERRLDLLVRCAIAVAGSGATVVLIECALRFYRMQAGFPRWSMYALFPCLVVAVGLLLLNKRARLKSELRRRFYV